MKVIIQGGLQCKKGGVRWLLRKMQPRALTVQLNLSTPVSPDQINAEIRRMVLSIGKPLTTQVK